MNIVIDATVLQLPSTGVAKATLGLYSACVEQFPSLQVSALHRRPLKCIIPEKLHPEHRGWFLPRGVWRTFLLPAYVMLKQPDFVHFPWNGNVPRGLSHTKVITTLNDVLPLAIPGYFKSMQDEKAYRRRVQADLNRTDVLITISEYSKNEILRNFSVKSEPVVIPLGPTLPFENGKPCQNIQQSGDYFVYVGGYDARKGIDRLIEIFISLHRDKIITSRLILTGSKNYFSADFRRLVDEGVRSGVIEEKGYVSDEELAMLLINSIALVYPSRYEGFGLPPLDAMALGCPVITTRCTAIPEVCGNAVCYINPDDDNSFAEGIVALINDKELRQRLKEEGVKQSSKFTWTMAANIFHSSLSQVSVHGHR